VNGEAVLLQLRVAVIDHDGGDEMELDVGAVEFAARLQEGAGLEEILPPRPLLAQHVVQAGLDLVEARLRGIGGDGLGALVDDADVEVVLHVAADFGQRRVHGDAELRQQGRIADAGELQDLRALHGAGGEQHLLVRVDALRGLAGAACVLDADRTPLLDQDARGVGVGDHREIAALERGPQVSERGAPAFAVLDGELVGAEAFLLVAVEVARHRVSRRRARLHEGLVERVV